jgi:hypothetical protein
LFQQVNVNYGSSSNLVFSSGGVVQVNGGYFANRRMLPGSGAFWISNNAAVTAPNLIANAYIYAPYGVAIACGNAVTYYGNDITYGAVWDSGLIPTPVPAAALTGLIYSNITGSATSSVPVVGGVIVDDDRGLVGTNETRAVTLTNSGNQFAGNGAGLTGIPIGGGFTASLISSNEYIFPIIGNTAPATTATFPPQAAMVFNEPIVLNLIAISICNSSDGNTSPATNFTARIYTNSGSPTSIALAWTKTWTPSTFYTNFVVGVTNYPGYGVWMSLSNNSTVPFATFSFHFSWN